MKRTLVWHIFSSDRVSFLSTKAKQSEMEGIESSLIARYWRFTSYLCFCFLGPTLNLEALVTTTNTATIVQQCTVYWCSLAINGIATVIRSVFILSQSWNKDLRRTRDLAKCWNGSCSANNRNSGQKTPSHWMARF